MIVGTPKPCGGLRCQKTAWHPGLDSTNTLVYLNYEDVAPEANDVFGEVGSRGARFLE